jgi:hypothetical protein
MFNRYQAVFRSRWRALLWSAGVLLTAYCSVPSPDEEDAGAGAAVAQLLGPAPEAKPARHVNPWAMDK